MKQKLIYILSLEHSGSTILDLFLSSHQNILSLGESVFVLEKKQTSTEQTKDYCSCGKLMGECDFWGGFNGHSYFDLLNYIKKKYGENMVISDSSKKLYFLKEILKNNLDLKIIFLVKDARNYSFSMKRVFFKEKRKGNLYLRHLLNWYKKNREMESFLKQSNLNYLFVSYEKLCLEQAQTTKSILQFASLPNQALNLKGTGNHHLAFGNRAKLNNTGELVYDDRWKKSLKAKLFICLLPWVWGYNKKLVK